MRDLINKYLEKLEKGEIKTNLEMFVASSLYHSGHTNKYSDCIKSFRFFMYFLKRDNENEYNNIMLRITNVRQSKGL